MWFLDAKSEAIHPEPAGAHDAKTRRDVRYTRLLFYSPRCFRLGLFVFRASEGPLTTHLDAGSTRRKDLKRLLGLEHDISVVSEVLLI
jgi:hypothetical protein